MGQQANSRISGKLVTISMYAITLLYQQFVVLPTASLPACTRERDGWNTSWWGCCAWHCVLLQVVDVSWLYNQCGLNKKRVQYLWPFGSSIPTQRPDESCDCRMANDILVPIESDPVFERSATKLLSPTLSQLHVPHVCICLDGIDCLCWIQYPAYLFKNDLLWFKSRTEVVCTWGILLNIFLCDVDYEVDWNRFRWVDHKTKECVSSITCLASRWVTIQYFLAICVNFYTKKSIYTTMVMLLWTLRPHRVPSQRLVPWLVMNVWI